MAYKLPEGPQKEEMRARLDHREKDGYALIDVTVETRDGALLQAATYVATPDNPSYLGPAPVEEMAATIASAVGPSGPNIEYLLSLSTALTSLGISDTHIEGLVAALPPSGVSSPSEQ